eukprot:4896059-Lingulodinium_polyedra.AAC.1
MGRWWVWSGRGCRGPSTEFGMECLIRRSRYCKRVPMSNAVRKRTLPRARFSPSRLFALLF